MHEIKDAHKSYCNAFLYMAVEDMSKKCYGRTPWKRLKREPMYHVLTAGSHPVTQHLDFIGCVFFLKEIDRFWFKTSPIDKSFQ